MPLIACGFNHKTAPVELREKAVFADDKATRALKDVMRLPAVNEALILSTCNRTELYTDAREVEVVSDWFARTNNLSLQDLKPHLYFHYDDCAVRHMMRVASGLDSMVLGESQILAQLKRAFHLAREAGGVGKQLDHLMQNIFSVTKQIRSDTKIGGSALSVAYTAVNLAKRIFSDLKDCTVLLVGAGEMIDLAALHLNNHTVKRMIVANRTLEHTQTLVEKYHAHAITISDIPMYLKEADIVISCTASPLPIIGKGAVESALKSRAHKPIFMIDIAMPRDIESEVGELEDVYLYNLDDLKNIVDDNLKSRKDAAVQAEQVIDWHVQHMMREMDALNSMDTICAYRNKIEAFRDEVLEKALAQSKRGEALEKVLMELSRTLVNKIMHDPTMHLRQAAYDGRVDVLMMARKLLGLK